MHYTMRKQKYFVICLVKSIVYLYINRSLPLIKFSINYHIL